MAKKQPVASSKPQKKAAAASAGSVNPEVAPAGEVVIRCSPGEGGVLCRVRLGPKLQQAAMEWTSVLRNRRRWTGSEQSVEAQGERIRETFQTLGIDEAELEQIAAQPVVEVAVRYVREQEGWEARVFPWEHALSSATRPYRTAPLTIVRTIARADVAPTHIRAPMKVLYVESAPCGLREQYAFEAEKRLVTQAFERPGTGGGIAVETIADPTLDALEQKIKTLQPDVIHLAGFDSHQASRILPEASLAGVNAENVYDGYLLQRADGRAELVPARRLAQALTAAGNKPSLVSLNFYNSGARVASLCTAHGAGAAIGYQDDFNDRLAETLYDRLYWAWVQDREDLLSAFQYAWSEVRGRSTRLLGTGVTLWGNHSWLAARRLTTEGRERLAAQALAERNTLLVVPGDGEDAQMTADVLPYRELNYSILHNRNQRVFERFVIAKKPGKVQSVSVSASLGLDANEIPFEMTATEGDDDWSEATVDLSEKVCVPLVSRLMRSLRESVKTTITAKVSWGNRVIYHKTHPITLLAIDEWKDDDDNRMWLPSFVQPGDRAVLKVIEAAQRYLGAISDDFVSAGFDGYQSEDPEFVDIQARAIWTAIVQEFELSYINPPPSFVLSSQRLRTPGSVLAGRRGTCIDLAVLYAACLEFVNIHPLMILLSGHAFPAYWRSEDAHERFVNDERRRKSDGSAVEQVEQAAFASTFPMSVAGESGVEAVQGARGGSTGEAYPWYERASAYPWLISGVRSGDIVPLETVFLTQRASFEEAVSEGHANLSRPEEFDSVLDIRLARDRNVTPLPLPEGEYA